MSGRVGQLYSMYRRVHVSISPNVYGRADGSIPPYVYAWVDQNYRTVWTVE